MKKLLFLTVLLFSAVCASAHEVWKSSTTATADTAQILCTQQHMTRHGALRSVCVNTGAAGTFTVYNASATAANPVAAIDTTAKGCQVYEISMSSGIVYTNSATANVTVSYDCY